jgi:hypothetical protein
MNFSSENTTNGSSMFRNTVGTTTNFANGPQLLWSNAVNIHYDLKDSLRYNVRSSINIGRNTAIRQQTYFYATAGFDEKMEAETSNQLKKYDTLAWRFKGTNYLLKFMSFTYRVMNQVDWGSEKILKHTAGTWTESTRQALQKGTSGVVTALDLLRRVVNQVEGWHFKGGFWKEFPRKDFQPNSIMQVANKKGVFLGAQYENKDKEGERTTAALYLDNMIRLRASSTPASNAASVFYPRDVQPQSNMAWYDYASPDKAINEVKHSFNWVPAEYAEFNGFKVLPDSGIDIGSAGIDSYSNAITSEALNHSQKSVKKAVLEYKIAQSFADEIEVKLEIATKQVHAIQPVDGEEIEALTPAEMAMAPLAAAAKAADKTQKAFLLAEATMLRDKLARELGVAKSNAEQKKRAADASKDFSEIKTSADFFEISHESGENKVSIQGSSDGLNFETNQTKISVIDKEISLLVDGSAGLCTTSDELMVVVENNGLICTRESTKLIGGGSEIQLANNSVTIGDLKITQVHGKANLNLLEKSNKEISELKTTFEKLEKSFKEAITAKNDEIKELKQQVANLGNSAKSKKKKFK